MTDSENAKYLYQLIHDMVTNSRQRLVSAQIKFAGTQASSEAYDRYHKEDDGYAGGWTTTSYETSFKREEEEIAKLLAMKNKNEELEQFVVDKFLNMIGL